MARSHQKYAANYTNPAVFSQKEIDQAWDRFLCGVEKSEPIKVRSSIINSWERCQSNGVNPSTKLAPIVASQEALDLTRIQNRDLLLCSQSTIDLAKVLLNDLETVLFITDRNALNIEIVGDPRTLDSARDISLLPGSGWQEIFSGSNAVGTAIESNLPTQVHGQEHFCEGFKPWSCTAACIYDPYDKQRIGVIDISGLSANFDRFHLPLVVSWANTIQAELEALNTLRWAKIEEAILADTKLNSADDFLLFDKQGRFISSNTNDEELLRSFIPQYKNNKRFRLNLERYGGEERELESLSFNSSMDSWIQPIADPKRKSELLGFKVHLPGSDTIAKASHKYTHTEKNVSRSSDSSDVSALNLGSSLDNDKVKLAAKSPLPILLLGDTGSGKEYVAKAVHAEYARPDAPFVALNCGAFSKDLLNGELFGYIEGAFTGAKKGGMAGKIEAANGGILFLDEIGEMPLEIQPVFLRVLQEMEIYRVGETKPRPVKFKLIAATNIDLKQAVAEGRFRKDLYYRIANIVLKLNPLSERKEEIPGLIESILYRISFEYKTDRKFVSDELLEKLQSLPWPGNIRELSNVLEYMVFMSTGNVLMTTDLPPEYIEDENIIHTDLKIIKQLLPENEKLISLEDAEKTNIAIAIKTNNGNMTKAAKLLGIAKSTLYQKVKKYSL
ncbi:sigma-54-dependent Fis family transcriptional regulator [Neptuniibacter pectenicola]|uniref:sigma-54-dependent Fis family transcriptional regulator n=1 Tax=Neptuniibacter pectenicola TaxID=1806669 RepID=UPI000831BDA4|nr:sigma-54-dependent Fis family transcriptional regulator [Neptuniibacter pectenicola]